jgi:hypothetical protein
LQSSGGKSRRTQMASNKKSKSARMIVRLYNVTDAKSASLPLLTNSRQF